MENPYLYPLIYVFCYDWLDQSVPILVLHFGIFYLWLHLVFLLIIGKY